MGTVRIDAEITTSVGTTITNFGSMIDAVRQSTVLISVQLAP